jgi:hypothetical protein
MPRCVHHNACVRGRVAQPEDTTREPVSPGSFEQDGAPAPAEVPASDPVGRKEACQLEPQQPMTTMHVDDGVLCALTRAAPSAQSSTSVPGARSRHPPRQERPAPQDRGHLDGTHPGRRMGQRAPARARAPGDDDGAGRASRCFDGASSASRASVPSLASRPLLEEEASWLRFPAPVEKSKRPLCSWKNRRFSGKKRLKRSRLTCWSSASTCAKSVLAVMSRVRLLEIAYRRSNPSSRGYSRSDA